jgi:hypothetical protein
MPSMPNYFLGKGSQFAMLDQQFGGANFMNAYAAALRRLKGPGAQPLGDLAAEHADPASALAPGLNQADVTHFSDHWLKDKSQNGWWQDKHVEDILRLGFIEAIEQAQQAKKPIETWWVCADEDEFQIYICEGEQQITVMVFTPLPTHEDTHVMTEREPIWVVKKHDDYDDPCDVLNPGGTPEFIKKQVMCAPGP